MRPLQFATQIVFEWGMRCFGVSHMTNKRLRALRFAEEAIELAQTCDVSEEKLCELVRYVYARPVGAAYQEVGGTLVTLLVLCHALHVDPEEALQLEILRCLAKDPAEFAERNRTKLDAGFQA